MPGHTYRDERDECDLYEEKRASHDALLAIAYQNGREAGLKGLSPAGRPEDHDEDSAWLEGYRSGLAMRARAA